MPTYEYECGACGARFEKFQLMTDSPVRTCPECKARRVKRLIGTGAGVIFKGSGFYQTDYRSHSYAQESKKDKASSEGSTAKEAKSGDSAGSSKPAAAKSGGVKES